MQPHAIHLLNNDMGDALSVCMVLVYVREGHAWGHTCSLRYLHVLHMTIRLTRCWGGFLDVRGQQPFLLWGSLCSIVYMVGWCEMVCGGVLLFSKVLVLGIVRSDWWLNFT